MPHPDLVGNQLASMRDALVRPPAMDAWRRAVSMVLFITLVIGGANCTPGAMPPEVLGDDGRSMVADGGASVKPDTEGEIPSLSPEELRSLPEDGGPGYNRLVFELSPYLLLHATNPVDWYPWGEAAFEKARRENKPILLSVGYSTCHWCHVMARESFADDEVAALLNKHFVAIKVDREERPDIDGVYMEVTQAMTGRGGWPNTVLLTPDRQPFFAGTYFPKENRFGQTGLMELLAQIATAWDERREEILQSAKDATGMLQRRAAPEAGDAPDTATLKLAYAQLAGRYDRGRGGFGTAPKFPSPHNFYFLLRYWQRTQEAQALEMVAHTLRSMRSGGIYDQAGFGFHRYATDANWVLPHFEKMLYDQALIALAYLEAYQATLDTFFADTAREIFTYVLRDMTSPEGGFYSAENADSEGEEGLFYLWTMEELEEVLGKADGRFLAQVYHATADGNFQEEASRRRTGRNVLYLGEPLDERAAELGVSTEDLADSLEKARAKLLKARDRRVRPLRDDKILTDWNGLMIAALARGGRVLDDPAYTEAAEKAAQFVLGELRDEDGRLLHRHRQGVSSLPAHLEDYAYFAWALLELYESTFDVGYLQTSIDLTERQIADFWDADAGGFFLTAAGGEELLFRQKELYDGAQPSGNSVSALNLLRLGRITANTAWESMAEKLMMAFGAQISQAPSAFTHLMCALSFGLGPAYEVVVAGTADDQDTDAMLRALSAHFIPEKIVLFRPDVSEDPSIASIAEFTRYQTALDGRATAYVCRNYACDAPTTEIATMLESLGAGP